MTLLRFRITGSSEARDRVLDCLQSIEQVERVEELGDLMPALNDEDSSSAGLVENSSGEVYAVEVEIDGEDTVDLVRRLVEVETRDAGAVLELVDTF